MNKQIRKIKDNLLYIVIGIILAAYVFSILFMLGWAFITTFRSYFDFLSNPIAFPSKIIFQNWIDTFTLFAVPVYKNGVLYAQYYIEMMFLFSVLYAVGCAFMQTATGCICAYLTAKYKFKLGKIVYALVIITMIIPIVGSLPSELMMLRTLGLYDSFFGMYFMKMNFLGMYFLVFYATFKSLSWGYAESAFMDGASHLTVMLRIMLPLARTTFLAVFILNFIVYWNDYQIPMLFLPSYPTMAFGLFYMKFAATQNFGKLPLQLTGCMMVALPVFVLFAVFQKRMMGNLTMGGLKG